MAWRSGHDASGSRRSKYNSVFTTPQTTNNQAGLAQITGRFDLWPKWSLASNFYFRQFDQYHVDGNDADITDCGDEGGTPGNACLPTTGFASANANDYQFTNHGQPIPYLGDSFPYGTTAYTATHTSTFGTQEQLTNTDKILDHDNYFVFGGSVDQSYTHFSSDDRAGRARSQFPKPLSSVFPDRRRSFRRKAMSASPPSGCMRKRLISASSRSTRSI